MAKCIKYAFPHLSIISRQVFNDVVVFFLISIERALHSVDERNLKILKQHVPSRTTIAWAKPARSIVEAFVVEANHHGELSSAHFTISKGVSIKKCPKLS